ncbi:MAG: BLUF domain-containing protein [Salinarimonas sp.]
MTTLSRLMYVSRPCLAWGKGGFLGMCDDILVTARRRNEAAVVTGVLVAEPTMFAQVLEGSRAAVSDTFARICRDPRHEAIEIVEMRAVDDRRFAEWSMSFCELDGAAQALVRRFRQGPSLDLRAMSPSALIVFMEAAAAEQAHDNALLGAPRSSGLSPGDIAFVEAAG